MSVSVRSTGGEVPRGDLNASGNRWAAPLILGGALLAIAWFRNLGWIPTDDGTLAHAAERVQLGQLPHVDFDEPYTGGLSFVNGQIFDLLGADMANLRVLFLLTVSVWAWVMFWLAKKLLSRTWAAGLVAGLLFGSVFAFTTPTPTWYTLFLGTAAVALALKYSESARVHWLVFAGFLVGVSALVKITGVYFTLPVAVVAFQAPCQPQARLLQRRFRRGVLVIANIFALALVLSDVTMTRLLALTTPLALVSLAEWEDRELEPSEPKPDASPVTALLIQLGAFAVPIMAYVLFYSLNGGFADLVNGVVRAPVAVVDVLAVDIRGAIPIAITSLSAFLAYRLGGTPDRRSRLTALVIGAFIVVSYLLYPRAVILAALYFIPWLAALGGVTYFSRMQYRPKALGHERSVVSALVLMAVGFSFIQFPASNQYFWVYMFAPSGLGLIAIGSLWVGHVSRAFAILLIGVGGILGLARLEGRAFALNRVGDATAYVKLEIPRLGLKVPAQYGYLADLVDEVRNHQDSSFLAGPDSPEIYFLTAKRNPTPVFFDLLSSWRPNSDFASYYRLLSPSSVALKDDSWSALSEALLDTLQGECSSESVHGDMTLFMGCR